MTYAHRLVVEALSGQVDRLAAVNVRLRDERDTARRNVVRLRRERDEAIAMADTLADVLAARGADDPGAMRAIEAYNEWPRQT